ncbi:DUF2183 domain-containing protein [Mycena indigotica]|uniref:DUF2183 domain-containing protein n=1 Tax=Mycena indigotica TaxID=2126181 RepID=A0A8H6SM25_9AGAR|nr:DUF2183 domain-containing protein [Mycena indigotica]KAF7301896.1 DUF2183 domain-containing protein [Mycena indigotica]
MWKKGSQEGDQRLIYSALWWARWFGFYSFRSLPTKIMRVFSLVSLALTATTTVNALPRGYQPPDKRSAVIPFLNNVLVFDAPAFNDPAKPGNTLVQLQAYVSLPQLSLAPALNGLSAMLKSTLGLDIDLDRVPSRLSLFATVPLNGKDVTVSIDGCSQSAKLQSTAQGGMAIQNVSLGACGSGEAVAFGKVKSDSDAKFRIFPSKPDGFGVISDIDDTVKISHSLDPLQLAKATLVDDPEPVAGMPQVFASLAKSLNKPQFIYVSASPFQLYPFLRSFIDDTYADSTGPIMLNNLSTTNIGDLVKTLTNPNNVFDYKSAMVDRIHGMYPKKKFLTVGDSTQKDPETYGNAIRKYGDFISCAWIRKVDGADNSDERFAAAFKGVDPSKIKIYTDAEIPGLANIDVAGGKCN